VSRFLRALLAPRLTTPKHVITLLLWGIFGCRWALLAPRNVVRRNQVATTAAMATAAVAAADPSPFVSCDDFVRVRNKQDEHLRDEFAEVRQQFEQVDARFDRVEQRFDRVEQRLDSLESEFHTFKVDVNARFDQIDARFNYLELDNKRAEARFSNYTLKNPTLRITPIPTYDPTRGIVQPEPAFFPRHAKDFYSLRSPSTSRHRTMLSYLVSFYDIQPSAPEEEDEDDDDADMEDSDPETATARRAVELLEAILGLNEDNFIHFRERAAELRLQRTAPSVIKRPQPPAQVEEARARRQRLELLPPAPAAAAAKDESWSEESARLGWRARTRSTPPSQRVTINNLYRRRDRR